MRPIAVSKGVVRARKSPWIETSIGLYSRCNVASGLVRARGLKQIDQTCTWNITVRARKSPWIETTDMGERDRLFVSQGS